MKPVFYNDQSHIADQFTITDHHIANISLFAFHKINSYKLSLRSGAYCTSKADMIRLIKNSLLNYVRPDQLLMQSGFFTSLCDN